MCLPKYWIEMQGLKRRDTVLVEINQEGNLIIKKIKEDSDNPYC